MALAVIFGIPFELPSHESRSFVAGDLELSRTAMDKIEAMAAQVGKVMQFGGGVPQGPAPAKAQPQQAQASATPPSIPKAKAPPASVQPSIPKAKAPPVSVAPPKKAAAATAAASSGATGSQQAAPASAEQQAPGVVVSCYCCGFKI